MIFPRRFVLLPLAALGACAPRHPAPTMLAPGTTGSVSRLQVTTPLEGGRADLRVNGDVGSTTSLSPPQVSYGRGLTLNGGRAASGAGNLSGGDVTLDFADTDIRDVVSQILGDTLQVTYSIDPAVRGTATFHSSRPIARSQLVPILQGLLAQNNAALVQTGDLYRVTPAASAGVPSFAAGDVNAGGAVIPLRYASAEELVKVLQPVVGAGGKLAADAGRNAIIITGEPQAKEALGELVQSFDTDVLAGQSYALLPVGDGDAKDLASTLQDAFRSQSGGALAGLVKVLPLQHANAILVVTGNPRYLADAQQVYALIQRNQKLTDRSWHVYYLQNSRADDIAYILQKAFTPHDVSAQPESSSNNQGANATGGASIGGNSSSSGSSGSSSSSGAQTGFSSGMGSSGSSGSTLGGGSSGSGLGSGSSSGALTLAGGSGSGGGSSNPLVGSLESGGGDQDDNTMRIIPDPQNNSVVVYATTAEEGTVEAMLRKIDLLPLEVRIDATIAEVTLNDNLSFGTQFFFKEGSVNQTLSNAASGFLSGTPGFVFGATAKGVQATLSALQAVTTVKVLSSPELMVLDNQAATLQVGSLVPYLTQSSQSTLTTGSPVINSIDYRPTGVLMQVTPRVNSGGLVTMDIAQEVSAVDNSTTNTAIGSPTFSDRSVKSRVVVQDGQTLGLAGLITDSTSTGNSGIPWVKDIPVLNLLFGTQTNTRQRTELLVLITPHVVHDQRDALALTQDLKDQLVNAAAVPAQVQKLETTGSDDPSAKLRKRLGLSP